MLVTGARTNSTAVLPVGILKLVSLPPIADRLRLTIINKDRTRPNETYIYTIISFCDLNSKPFRRSSGWLLRIWTR